MGRFDDLDRDRDEPPVVDIEALHRREWRRLELERRRRANRQRLIGGGVGLLLLAGVAFGAYQVVGPDGTDTASTTPVASADTGGEAAAPVRVDLTPLPAEPDPATPAEPAAPADPATPSAPGSPDSAATPGDTGGAPDADPQGSPAAVPPTDRGAENARTGAGSGPVVWVQAGHADPREPGYRDQTGASSGPFGSEIGFTTALAPKVVAKLRRAGVNARRTSGQVTPIAARGAVFISLHHDIPQGAAAFGHAITGANENYYHGEGGGTPSPVPYPDSAAHRPATTVSATVERRSRDLANRVSSRFSRIYTSANGARGRFTGVQTRNSNPRMMRYYGFYRTRADARVIVEAGAGSTDDTFLAKTDLIATAVSQGVIDHLRSRGLLAR